MNLKVISTAAGAAAVLLATAASAADVAPIVPSPPMVVVAPPPAPGFDFTGAYAGLAGGAYFEVDPVEFDNPRLGVLAGYNFAVGRLIVGVEGGVFWEGGDEFDATIMARTGLVVGGRALIYASVGYLRGLTYPFGWFTVGGGVEVGIGERLSIFGEAHYLVADGFSLQTGVKFHFGD